MDKALASSETDLDYQAERSASDLSDRVSSRGMGPSQSSGSGAKTAAVKLPLTDRDISLIKRSFEIVAPISEDAAAIFYSRLFAIAPDTKQLFKSDLKAQGRKLMAAIQTLVRGLDHPEKIIPVLEGLGQRHRGYGVREDHYDAVGAALIWTLSKGLGEAFDRHTEAAWTSLYNISASQMKHAASSRA